MSEIVCLRFGVDTLEATWAGVLPLAIRGDLETAKEQAIAADAPVLYPLAGCNFYVQPKGFRFYLYVIENELVSFRVGISAKMPMLQMRLSAYGLATMGHEALYAFACKAAQELGAIEEVGLSRIDIARDVQGFEPTREDMEPIRCRMKYRAHHQNGAGQTFQYGKGPLVFRLYNKTAQAEEKNLGWVPEMLAACPGYMPDRAVYRAEVQYRRQVLKELGVLSVADAFERLPELFRFGMTEVELRVPRKDDTITRWPVDERWAAIRDMPHTCELARVRKTPAMLGRFAAVRRALSAYETFLAYGKTADPVRDAAGFVNAMLREIELEEYDFAGRVEEKRRRIGLSNFGEEPL